MQVRDYLRDKGYAPKAEEGESMEVCFIKGDYRDFLREHSPEIENEVGMVCQFGRSEAGRA